MKHTEASRKKLKYGNKTKQEACRQNSIVRHQPSIRMETEIVGGRVFCTRWNGKTKAGGSIDALDSAEITGGLVTLLEDTMSFIRRNNRTLWYKEPMLRIEIPEYMERCVMEVECHLYFPQNLPLYLDEIPAMP